MACEECARHFISSDTGSTLSMLEEEGQIEQEGPALHTYLLCHAGSETPGNLRHTDIAG